MAISGKDRDLCIQALTAAQNIPDVAFEFLMSGYIPSAGDVAGAEEHYGDEGDAGEDAGAGAGAGGVPPGLANYNIDAQTMQQINALVSNPGFPLIRERMMQDPNFSAQFMQQL